MQWFPNSAPLCAFGDCGQLTGRPGECPPLLGANCNESLQLVRACKAPACPQGRDTVAINKAKFRPKGIHVRNQKRSQPQPVLAIPQPNGGGRDNILEGAANRHLSIHSDAQI